VVWVLADDYCPHSVQGGQAQRREDVAGRRVDLAFSTLVGHECLEPGE
jgi:hypothetical protein